MIQKQVVWQEDEEAQPAPAEPKKDYPVGW